MECNYIIKLPDGGEISIPTNFGTIDKTSEMVEIFESGRSNSAVELAQYINSATNGVLTSHDINQTILKNVDDLDLIISEINDKIESGTEYSSFESHLLKYLEGNSAETEDLKKVLNDATITMPYFKGIEAAGLVGVTNLSLEHAKIRDTLENSRLSGYNALLLNNIDTFFNYLKSYNLDNYFSNNLLSNSNAFSAESVNINGYTMFQRDNFTSLFLGAFKKVGESFSPQSLQATFGDSNFFTSSIDFEGNLELSPFEQALMSKDPENKALINKAINEVVNAISKNNPILKDAVVDLFIDLKPEIYVIEAQKSKLRNENLINTENAFEREYRKKENFAWLMKLGDNIDQMYSPSQYEELDLYNFFSNNINLREDLIQVNINDKFKPYILVTAIVRSPNGVKIVGERIKKDGTVGMITHTVKNGTKVYYRKKENPILEYSSSKEVTINEDTFPLKSKHPLRNELVKKLGSFGDTVMYKNSSGKNLEGVIVAIYPNYVSVVSSENLLEAPTNISYSKIHGIQSKKLSELVDLEGRLSKGDVKLEKYSKVPENVPISKGDIITDPTSKKGLKKIVLETSKTHVYVFSGNEAVQFLQAIPRNSITDARSYTHNQIELSEIDTIYKESMNHSEGESRKATMSTYTDGHSAQEGDFFTYDLDGVETFGKVLDVETGKAVVWNNAKKDITVANYLNIENATFFTERTIASKYAMSILRVNSWKLEFPKTPTNLHNEVRYVIPKSFEGQPLFLLPNNYANVGQYKDAKYINPKTEIDITDQIVQMLEAKGVDVPGGKIYSVKMNANSNLYMRNLDTLNRVSNFNLLPSDVKHELNPIHKGVYFSIFKGNSIGNEIYRVSKVVDDVVTAHYNRINNMGQLLTFEKTFSMKTLLASKTMSNALSPEGSIASLFLQWGNRNLNLITEAIDRDLSVDRIVEKKNINTLIYNMSNTFKELGITVEKSSEGFEGTQKAKITSDEKGQVKIVLNDENGSYSDLVHENLHIFMTLLRYNSLSEYDSMLKTIINNDPELSESEKEATRNLNVYEKEEYVVNKLVDLNQGFNTFLAKDLNKFMSMIVDTLHILSPDYEFNANELVHNKLGFLNTELKEFYGIKNMPSSSPFYNIGLLSAEPSFRNWLKNENVILKCN